MGELIQQVFNDISLEKEPMMWQSKKQSSNMTEKRIQFLIEVQETLFENVGFTDKVNNMISNSFRNLILLRVNQEKMMFSVML